MASEDVRVAYLDVKKRLPRGSVITAHADGRVTLRRLTLVGRVSQSLSERQRRVMRRIRRRSSQDR